MDVLHSGFGGLRFTVEADIPPEFRKALFEAKANAIKTNAYNCRAMALAHFLKPDDERRRSSFPLIQ